MARAKGTLTPWLPVSRPAPGHAPHFLPVPRPRAADPRPPGVRTAPNPRPPTGGRPPGAAAVACFLLLYQLSSSVSVLRHRPPRPLSPPLARQAFQGALHSPRPPPFGCPLRPSWPGLGGSLVEALEFSQTRPCRHARPCPPWTAARGRPGVWPAHWAPFSGGVARTSPQKGTPNPAGRRPTPSPTGDGVCCARWSG